MGILFPMAWFSEQISSISVLFNGFFSQQWVHIVMHTSLYAILMVFLCFLGNQMYKKDVYIVWIFIGVIALAQEMLQIILAGRGFTEHEIFDLGIDLSGAVFGFAIYWGWRNWRENEKIKIEVEDEKNFQSCIY